MKAARIPTQDAATPPFAAVRVGIQEVRAHAFRSVHVVGFLRPDRHLDPLAPQVVYGAREVGGVDLQSEVKASGEPGVGHRSPLGGAEVLGADPGEVQPIRGGWHGEPEGIAIEPSARLDVVAHEDDFLDLLDPDRMHGGPSRRPRPVSTGGATIAHAGPPVQSARADGRTGAMTVHCFSIG